MVLFRITVASFRRLEKCLHMQKAEVGYKKPCRRISIDIIYVEQRLHLVELWSRGNIIVDAALTFT